MNILSIDAETDGLWGNPFAIAATVTNENGEEIASFSRRIGDSWIGNEWVIQNILPYIQDIDVCVNYDMLLIHFSHWYLKNKTNAVIIAHCPLPVEAHLFKEMHRLNLIGDWDAPFPLIGLEGLLDHAGENPTDVNSYMEKHRLPKPDGHPHNPLYDCRVSTIMYRHLKGWI